MTPKGVSKIELAKALKAIRDVCPSEDDYERVKSVIVPPEGAKQVDAAVAGLSEEDEFALMCRLMGTTTHMVALGQRPVIGGDYIVPDFLARFQPGCFFHGFTKEDSSGFNCLIEVKSTRQFEYGVHGSQLRRRRNFAETFGLPLLFAVRLLEFGRNALWIIVEDSDREKRSLKVSSKDLIQGVRHVLWDEYFYMLKPGTHFRSIYDSDCKAPGVRHSEYGIQREFRIVAGDQEQSFGLPNATVYTMFFEAFDLAEASVDRHDSLTEVVLKPRLQLCSIADMLYCFMRMPQDEHGQPLYDSSRLLARADQETDGVPFNRRFVEAVASPLFQERILYRVGIGDEKANLEKWRRYGGMK